MIVAQKGGGNHSFLRRNMFFCTEQRMYNRSITQSLITSVMLLMVPFLANAGNYEERIQSYALLPYTEQGYPKTVREFRSRLPEIERYRRKIAEIALDSGKCDKVEMSELSTDSSIRSLKFWVDCTNGQRIYLTEREIDSKTAPLTQEDKSWSRKDATKACQNAILDRALIPGTVKIRSLTGTRFYKAPLTHNVVMEVNFDAENAFGTKIPYSATCHFEPGKVGTIDIKMRR